MILRLSAASVAVAGRSSLFLAMSRATRAVKGVELLEGRTGVSFLDLPPGTYLLRLWHPEVGEKIFPIKVGDGPGSGQWTLAVSRPAFETRKNKLGQDYPASKDEGSY